jgi:hypothetical protein
VVFVTELESAVTNRASYWPFFVEPASGVRDQPFTCIALPSTLNGEIRGSKIHINAGVMSPDGVSACLLEEIFQSMGFFGETPGHPETVLNDDIGYQELESMDRLLLRTLYDPRLSAGMNPRSGAAVGPADPGGASGAEAVITRADHSLRRENEMA